MLWQHMVTPGAILLLFGGHEILVFFFQRNPMIRVPWISQVHSIKLPSSFLREQPCNHKLPSSDTVILHVHCTSNGLFKSRFLNNRPQYLQYRTIHSYTLYFERPGLPS